MKTWEQSHLVVTLGKKKKNKPWAPSFYALWISRMLSSWGYKGSLVVTWQVTFFWAKRGKFMRNFWVLKNRKALAWHRGNDCFVFVPKIKGSTIRQFSPPVNTLRWNSGGCSINYLAILSRKAFLRSGDLEIKRKTCLCCSGFMQVLSSTMDEDNHFSNLC